MNYAMLKQNSMILFEVSKNYERLLQKRKNSKKENISKIDIQIKNFRKQFLYLLAAIDKLVKEQKNAK